MDLNALSLATRTTGKLAAFVEGGALLSQLMSLGDVEMAAAQHALERAGRAEDVRAEVTLAVGHLQTAHQAYRRLYALSAEERSAGWGMRSALEDMYAARKDFWTCVWMAVCDRYLGEARNMRQSLDLAEDALRGFYDPDLYAAAQAQLKERGAKPTSALGVLARDARRNPERALSWLGIATLDIGRSMLHPVKFTRLALQRSPGPDMPGVAVFAEHRREQEELLPLARATA